MRERTRKPDVENLSPGPYRCRFCEFTTPKLYKNGRDAIAELHRHVASIHPAEKARVKRKMSKTQPIRHLERARRETL